MSLERQAWIEQTRRRFLTSSASGLGAAALASILAEDGVLRTADAVEPAGGEQAALKAALNAGEIGRAASRRR
jgi:hypothetical protein